MKGNVDIFNVVKGVGFLTGRVFFHQNDLVIPPGFRAIGIGKEVEYTPATREGRPVAKAIKPVNGTGVQVASPLPKAILLGNQGIVGLRVDTMDRIYAKEDLYPFGEFTIAPSVWGIDGSFRAFRVGGVVNGFTVRLPNPTQKRVFLLLDPNKKPLSSTNGEIRVALGSYVLSLEKDGSLRIQCVGRRYQSEKGGGNWVVLEHRLQLQLNLNGDIANQLPTSGLERDNDEFLQGIAEAATLLKEGVMVS